MFEANKTDNSLFQDFSIEHIVQIIDTIADPIFVKDRSHRWILVNEALCEFMNQSKDTLLGMSDYDFFPEAEADVFWEKDEKVFQTQELNINEEHLTASDGKQHTIVTKKRCYTDSDGNQYLVGIIRDVTEYKELQGNLEVSLEKLSHQARHDHLTGAFNRYEFSSQLEQVLLDKRDDSFNHVLCVLDLDGFKKINDHGGHLAGDKLLLGVTNVIKNSIRRNDMLCRLGGDEFAIILFNCSVTQAEKVVNKVLKSINDYQLEWQGEVFSVGASIGVTEIKEKHKSSIDALKSADSACYVAKNKGKNQIYFAT